MPYLNKIQSELQKVMMMNTTISIAL